MSLDPTILKQEYEQNGIDFNYLLDEIETEMRWKNLIFKLYSKKIKIDEKNIDNEVNNFIKNNSTAKKFKLSKIEIQLTSNDNVELKKYNAKRNIIRRF